MSFTDFDRFYIGSRAEVKIIRSYPDSLGDTGYDVVECNIYILDEKTLRAKKNKSYDLEIRLKEHHMIVEKINKKWSNQKIFTFWNWILDIETGKENEFKEMGLSEEDLKEIYNRAKYYSKHKHKWMMGFDTPCKLRTFVEDFGKTDYVSISNKSIRLLKGYDDYMSLLKFLHKNGDKYDEIIFLIDYILRDDGKKFARAIAIPQGTASAHIFNEYDAYANLLFESIDRIFEHFAIPDETMKEAKKHAMCF